MLEWSSSERVFGRKLVCVWYFFFFWERWVGDIYKVLVRREVSKWEESIIWKIKDI